MMTSLHKVEWTIKSGTPRSYDYLIELKEGNIDYWYIRYVDRITSDEERKKALTAIYGEFAKLKLGGKSKFLAPLLLTKIMIILLQFRHTN